MENRTIGNVLVVLAVAVLVSAVAADECLAVDVEWTCVDNDRIECCAGWEQQDPPDHGKTDDFYVDFNCTGCSTDPQIDLVTPDLTWRVYCKLLPGRISVANIGALTANGEGDYEVRICCTVCPAPGAQDVDTIDITPAGNNYGSLVDSGINGDLTGPLTVQEDSGDNGGVVDLDINGEMGASSSVTAFTLTYLDVGGSVDSGAGIFIHGDMSGTISIGDDLDGDIILWEACDGDIIIGNETGEDSLIACFNGLEDYGRIIVNDDRHVYNHNGTIYVGQEYMTDPLLDVTFDGYIMIKDDDTSPSGGDNLGTIEVLGCQPEEKVDDICICGGDGSVTLTQDGCDYTATVDCDGHCPVP